MIWRYPYGLVGAPFLFPLCFHLGNMGADCRFKTDEQGYPHGLETSILWTREGVRRKVVVSDVITLIVVVM